MFSSKVIWPCLALIVVSSCSPQDKLVKPAANAGGGGGRAVGASNARGDSDKQMALLMDRSVEAVHLIQVALDADYANKNKVKSSKDAQSSTVTLVSESQIENDKKSIVQKWQFLTDVQVSAEGAVQSIKMIEDESAMRFEKLVVKNADKTKQLDVSVNNHKYVLKAKAKADSKILLVTVQSIDEINLKSGKSISNSKVSFELERSESNPLVFKLTQIKLNQVRIGASSDNFEIVNKDSAMTVDLSGACPVASADLKMVSVAVKKPDNTPVYQRDIRVSPEEVSVSSGPNKTVIKSDGCEGRLTTDLSKIL